MKIKIDFRKLFQSFKKSIKGIWNAFPLLVGIILLISLINNFIPNSLYTKILQNNIILDSLLGGILGSIFAGNPITSYIIAGELTKQGISLIAITTFIVTWITVGIVQLPAESILLGKKFAITRNISAFFMGILVAIITTLMVSLI